MVLLISERVFFATQKSNTVLVFDVGSLAIKSRPSNNLFRNDPRQFPVQHAIRGDPDKTDEESIPFDFFHDSLLVRVVLLIKERAIYATSVSVADIRSWVIPVLDAQTRLVVWSDHRVDREVDHVVSIPPDNVPRIDVLKS